MKSSTLAILTSALIFAGCATSNSGGPSPSSSDEAPPSAPPAPPADNSLSAEEQAQGWQLLFDGKSTSGWREFGKDTFPAKGWNVVDGLLIHDKNEEGFRAGDIITVDQYDNFELKVDFRLTPKGNSGIKYLVSENRIGTTVGKAKSAVSFEFQILDDDLHPDAKAGKNGNRTVGSLYDLIPAAADKVVNPIGQWNHAHLIVDGNRIEHWLNGKKVVAYERGSADLKARIAESKFKDVDGFGENPKGHILLQDHNDEIAFRNIKLRKLPTPTASLGQ